MRSRTPISWLGTVLLVTGLAVLVGVGITYARSDRAAVPHAWSSVQASKAKSLTKKLAFQNNHFLHVKKTAPHGVQLGEPAIRIRIPAAGVDSPVIPTQVVGGVWQVADWAIGYLAGPAYPGSYGNYAVAAHDDIKGEIFKRLGELTPGDKVYVYTKSSVFVYVVNGQQAVDPTDGAVLDQTPHQRKMTMITCTPYWVDSQRLVVTALLQSQHPRTSSNKFSTSY